MLLPTARHRRLAPFALVLFLACSRPSVDWTADRMETVSAERFAISATGNVVADDLARFESLILPPTAACPGSLRLSRAGSKLFAVWWSPRADSGARLLAAHSTNNGATWSTVAPVDTVDRAGAGCRRAPPSIA